MVIAVAARSSDAESEVGSRFCTSKCFHLVNTKTHEVEVIDNAPALEAMQEVETLAADLIINKHAKLVLAGQYGPKAFQALCAAGIGVVAAVQGKVGDVVDAYDQKDYECEASPDAEPWWNWR